MINPLTWENGVAYVNLNLICRFIDYRDKDYVQIWIAGGNEDGLVFKGRARIEIVTRLRDMGIFWVDERVGTSGRRKAKTTP